MLSHNPVTAPLGADQTALLSAVIRHPDEDAPRLAYAGWLDEHGDPDRAEFIRLQVELASAAEHPANREELEARAAHLLNLHRPEWEAGVRGEGVVDVTFRRGFVDAVTATADAFVRAGGEWWLTHPIRHVRLEEEVWRYARRIAAAPHLDNVRSLWLADDFDEWYLRTWAEAPRPGGAGRFPSLETLYVGGWTDEDDFYLTGASALAAWQMPRLRALHLLNLMEDDRTATALAAAPWLAHLESLAIWTSWVGDYGLDTLLSSPLRQNLSDLTIGWSLVTASGLQRLADLPAEPPLRRLSLAGSRKWVGLPPSVQPQWSIDPDRLGAVLAKHPALQIDLTHCPIPPNIQTVVRERFGKRVRVGSVQRAA